MRYRSVKLRHAGSYAVEREDDRTTTTCGEAASCRCGSVSIDMLRLTVHPRIHHGLIDIVEVLAIGVGETL